MVIQDMEAAQQAVLGAMLIKPSIVGEILAEVRDEDFVSPTHRMTFQVIRTLFSEGKKPDPIVVLHRLGASDQQPWREYIIDLMDRTPTAANVWEYVPILKEQAKLYHLRLLGERLAQAGSLDDAAKCMADGNAMMVDKPGLRYVTMEQALLDFYDRHKTRKEYLTWGLDKLNDRLFVDRGDMVVLGGYASAGKTLLAIQFAWHWAKLGRKVGFYSLETGEAKLEDRLIAYNMRLDFGKIKRSELTEDDYKALAMASKRLVQPTLEWVPASGMTVDEIRSSALSRGYNAIFIDYLQLIQGDKRRSRAEEVAGISIGLHQLSQSTGITVVALSQLSRPEKGGDGVKAPTLASLRESGQIKQDADVAMLLYPPGLGPGGTDQQDKPLQQGGGGGQGRRHCAAHPAPHPPQRPAVEGAAPVPHLHHPPGPQPPGRCVGAGDAGHGETTGGRDHRGQDFSWGPYGKVCPARAGVAHVGQ